MSNSYAGYKFDRWSTGPAEGFLAQMAENPKIAEKLADTGGRGVLAQDINGKIIFFNREAEKITGVSRKDVLGKDCNETMKNIFGGKGFSYGRERSEKRECEYLINFATQNGKLQDIKMTISNLNDVNGTALGAIMSLKKTDDRLKNRNNVQKPAGFLDMIGQNDKMLDIYQQIKDVAEYDYPVHISGETGTGKELVAKAIHESSPRRNGPFVPINCGALPEGLVESELFGHIKGAFSGAIRDKKGRFELADGGTIFLDEVAELSKFIQVKLLRFLQDGIIEKVGGEKAVTVNVRVISATNKILKEEIKKEKFRDDLYYRLNVIPITMPPLRERKDDISQLANHFLQKAGQEYGQRVLSVSHEAMVMLEKYKWPGNVRELQNVVQFAIVKSKNDVITSDSLPHEIESAAANHIKRGASKKLAEENVKEALVKAGGNKAKAARYLGVGRATLYRFIVDHPESLEADVPA